MDREETDEAPSGYVDQPDTPIDTPGQLVLSSAIGQYETFKGAGEGAVSEDDAKKLAAYFPEEDHDIKPTGELFVAQVHVRRRLNEVFRPGGWALVPMSEVKVKPGEYGKKTFFQSYHLVAGGRFLASAWGEQEYQPANENTTEATALEGVKSNALVRCCKDLGIASECWDKRWCDEWKKKWAVEVWTTNIGRNPKMKGKKKKLYRRKDAKAFEYPWTEKRQDRED